MDASTVENVKAITRTECGSPEIPWQLGYGIGAVEEGELERCSREEKEEANLRGKKEKAGRPQRDQNNLKNHPLPQKACLKIAE
ncbi:hypothetical protein Y1Q_0020070 [Alligator mississippiensis]|uniref:Uncharacterized protein n=1 Tax=Alligator mississippiensis TaxID=8496 RepID=A0A151LYY7_ALLMI|nr:hypothetical protein Y1Q_0020070 [Alligator mississippiensis]